MPIETLAHNALLQVEYPIAQSCARRRTQPDLADVPVRRRDSARLLTRNRPTAVSVHQPFTPPAVRPPTIQRWLSRNTIVIGKPDRIAAAAKSPHRYFCGYRNWFAPTASVRLSWLCSSTEATGYSMIAPMNASRNTTIRI